MISKEAATIILAWKLKWWLSDTMNFIEWYCPDEFKFTRDVEDKLSPELVTELIKLLPKPFTHASLFDLAALTCVLKIVDLDVQQEILCWMQMNFSQLQLMYRRPKNLTLRWPAKQITDSNSYLTAVAISSTTAHESTNFTNLAPTEQKKARLKALLSSMGTR